MTNRLLATLLVFTSPLTDCLAQSSQPIRIEPRLAECVLLADGHTIKPSKVTRPWQEEHVAGAVKIIIDRNKLTALNTVTGEGLMERSIDVGLCWRWLSADDHYAYFGTYPAETKSPPTIRRFVLGSKTWDSDIVLSPVQINPDDNREVILDVLSDQGYVVVLSATLGDPPTNSILSYRVTCFRESAAESLWQRTFQSAGERPEPGAYLLSPAAPAYANAEIHHLTRMGNKLVVCAGAAEHIVCLNQSAGADVWQLERVWEFRRCFIGPSVWEHLMCREGTDPFYASTQPTAATTQASAKQTCAIVAGPVLITESSSTRRLFVAVAKGPEPYSGYVSDCFVYEIDEKGKPIALINVPRMIMGSRFAVSQEGIVWACQNNSFVRITSSEQTPEFSGPGGSDCIGRIDWYRQFRSPDPPAWLSADQARDPIAFTSTHAFRLAGGGYVLKRGDGLYQFPLETVNLITGLQREMTLQVPYTGDLPEPQTNYRSVAAPDGGSRIHTWGSYGFAPTVIQCVGGAVLITLGMENSSAVLHFNLKEIEQTTRGDPGK